jgi:hypothetical protein
MQQDATAPKMMSLVGEDGMVSTACRAHADPLSRTKRSIGVVELPPADFVGRY